MILRIPFALLGLAVVAASGAACRRGAQDTASTITLGAYTVPKEAYEQRIIPAFKRLWKERTGKDVEFQASYVASGAQARAIVGGFEADVAALSLEGDVDLVTKAGLIKHDWKAAPFRGMVTASIVVLGVRPGNPKGIHGWEDLTRADVDVVTPDPATSGGAMWNINALWGAGLRAGGGNEQAAIGLLERVRRRIKALDTSGRESFATFERGVGDAAITYENELLRAQREGRKYDIVRPASTIRIDNPVAIIDANVDRHGNRAVVEAFVEFLWSAEAQAAFAEYGFRPVLPEVAAREAARFPEPEDLFTVEDLGGWQAIRDKLYAPDGIWARVNRAVAGR
jgi:sulfate/thiosulfate transport system substrate-binding protein